MALAIELAAARWPTLGLDGLTAGLSDQLRMLAGGPRADDRHRSVRAVLDWSHDLLEPADRALLRRVSVFVAPFTAEAAAEVAGFAPLEPAVVADGLARLAEQSLLAVTPSAGGTRYRALETIRQYGTERLTDAGELDDVRSRHLRWCLASAAALAGPAARTGGPGSTRWPTTCGPPSPGPPTARSSARTRTASPSSLAELTFTRNLLGESQQRYEQAAALAGDPAAAAAAALRHAAGVAGCRRLGDDMYRLHRAAAEAARRAGDTAGAARDLATAATTAYRFSGTFARLPSGRTDATRPARPRRGSWPATTRPPGPRVARGRGRGARGRVRRGSRAARTTTVPETLASAERAVDLARADRRPAGRDGRARRVHRRPELGRRHVRHRRDRPAPGRRCSRRCRSPRPARTSSSTRSSSATETSLGVGDLAGARRWGRQLAEHPLLAEVGHQARPLAAGRGRVRRRRRRRCSPAARASSTRGSATAGNRRPAWRRPPRRSRWCTACAATTGPRRVAGHRGRLAARRSGSADAATRRAVWPASNPGGYARHVRRHGPAPPRGRRRRRWSGSRRSRSRCGSGSPGSGCTGTWRCAPRRPCSPGTRTPATASPPPGPSWPATRSPAPRWSGRRPCSTATGAAARRRDAFDAAGCRYQSARTLVLAGGEHATAGAAALAELGLAPGT